MVESEVHWHGLSVSASLDPNAGRTVPGQRRAAAIIGETDLGPVHVISASRHASYPSSFLST